MVEYNYVMENPHEKSEAAYNEKTIKLNQKTFCDQY